MPVDFGLALIERHPKTELNAWMTDIETTLPKLEGHFQSVWMTDHLFWGELFAYEAWTVLTWLAARWPEFDVGPMVMCQNYRNPALLAKMASTLQVFSGGRFIMGIGAGWKEDEYRGYGYTLPPPNVRLEQLVETCEIFQRLWTQPGKISYQGKHYFLDEAILEPKPVPVPTLCIGVKGDRALGIATKYADWWNVSDDPYDAYKARMTKLDEHCEKIGRDPKTLRRTWFGRIVTGRSEAEVQRRAVSRDKPFTRDNAFLGTPAQIVEQMSAFVALGCDYFMVDVLDINQPDVLDMILNEIVPGVRRSAS